MAAVDTMTPIPISDPTKAYPGGSPSGSGSGDGSGSGNGSGNGAPPPITPPPTNPMTQESAQPAPRVLPGSKGATGASIAYGLDAVLRGAMKGREQAQQQKAYKLNKLMSGFGYAYKSASDQYLGMLQNDPDLAKKLGELNTITSSKQPTPEQQARAKELSSDPSVVKAQSVAAAADSAWQAQQQIYNNYLNPDGQKKSKSKGKSKGGDRSGPGAGGGGDQPNPIAMLQSSDPNEKLQGYLLIQQKIGPGYKREAQYLMSPQYQQSVSTARGQQAIEAGNTEDQVALRELRSQPVSPERDKKIADIENRTPNKDADKIRGERIALVEAHKAAGMSDDAANQQAAKDLTAKYGGRPRVTTKLEPDKNSPTGYAWVSKDIISGEEYSREGNAAPPRALVPSESNTTGTDAFGNVTHSHTERKPIIGGQGGSSATSATASATPSTTPSASTTSPARSPKSSRMSTVPPLDADGHIPSTAGNPQVIEAANQLLDGSDKDKLPAKVRELASGMARKYGWQQGKFTPKEQVMLRESTTFIDQALNNPALSALDGSYTDRMQLAQVLKSPDKEGVIGGALSVASAQNLDPKQAEFVRMYNQLVGTISGLAQLVRSGRATEATIDRLKQELPNPMTTKDSADGKKRLERLREEIDVAMKKGAFEGKGVSSASGASASDNKSPTAGESPKVIKWKRDAQGNPVPDTSTSSTSTVSSN